MHSSTSLYHFLKGLVLVFLILLAVSNHASAQCQIENGGFESWTVDTLEVQSVNDTFDYLWEVPETSIAQFDSNSTSLWLNFAQLLILGLTNDTSMVVTRKTTDSYSGNYAMKLDMDTGRTTTWSYGGFCSGVDTALTGALKFEGSVTDTVEVIFVGIDTSTAADTTVIPLLSGINTTISDSIIYRADTFFTGSSGASYVPFTLPIDSVPGTNTRINLYLSVRNNSMTSCAAYFDDLALTGGCIPDSTPTLSVANLPDLTGACSVGAPTLPTAIDACGSTLQGLANVGFPITTQGTTTITWIYTDSEGNTNSQTQDAIVDSTLYLDNVAPQPDQVSLPNITGQCSVGAPSAPTATDDCDGSITGTTTASFPITSLGNNTISWTFTDNAGNSSTQNQIIVIDDTTGPAPDQATLSAIIGDCSVSAPAAPTATDNCDGSITGTTSTTFPITAAGTTAVTWTFTDIAGNSTTQSQNIIVADSTDPVPDQANLPDIVGQCSVPFPSLPTATDNCDGSISATTNFIFPITIQGTTIVVWTYTDAAGNEVSQTQTVIVDDTISPIPDQANLPDVQGECSVSSPAVPTATDNCEGNISGSTNTTFPITTQGTTVITWTFTDNQGNSTTQQQNIIVEDTTAPIADVVNLPDIEGECSVSTPTAPSATDNCDGSVVGTTATNFPITTQGTTTITWTYTDNEGNSSSQTQNIVVTDTTDPVPDAASLLPFVAECEVDTIIPPTASDNCEGQLSGTSNVSFPITIQGNTTITWTFTDSQGNSSTQQQNVIVADTTPPEPNQSSLPTLTASCQLNSVGSPTANDNCTPGSITGSTSTSFPITVQGVTTIVWEFSDNEGNTSTQNQTVVIDDAIDPTPVTSNLPTVSSDCPIESPEPPIAVDNCSDTIIGFSNTSFPISSPGTTTVVWLFDDGNGNLEAQEQAFIYTPIDDSVSVTNSPSSGVSITAFAAGYTYQWLDCNDNNSPISGETGQSLVVEANGSYAVEISNGECSITSECIEITNVGDNDLNQLPVKIYPNPTRASIRISRPNSNVLPLVIKDAQGKTVLEKLLSEKDQRVDISDLPQGVYFIQLQDLNQSIHRRIIKL